MHKSESICELAKALNKAQAEMKGAIKDSSNPFFKSSYADLTSVWDAIREPFTKHGLSFVQAVEFEVGFPDHVFVDTIMLHTSGEYISGRIGMKPVKQDPQSVGSCITYCRRYGLQALSGVAPEDDDGNAASGTSNGKKPVPPTPTPAPKPQEAPKQDDGKISEAQLKRLFAIANKSDKTKGDITGWLNDHGMTSSKELYQDTYEELVVWIQAPKAPETPSAPCPDGSKDYPASYCDSCPRDIECEHKV